VFIAADCLIDPDPELGQHFQPSLDVAGFGIPKLEILLEWIRRRLDEVSEQRFHAVDDGGDGWCVPCVVRPANRHIHRGGVGDGTVRADRPSSDPAACGWAEPMPDLEAAGTIGCRNDLPVNDQLETL
jgi:hypothetical protein